MPETMLLDQPKPKRKGNYKPRQPDKPRQLPDLRATTVDVRKAIHLRMQGLSYGDIARACGCAKSTMIAHLRPFRTILANAPTPEALQDFRENLQEYMACVLSNLLPALSDPQKIEAATLNNVAYAYRQVYDTQRVESGKSVGNVGLVAVLLAADGKNRGNVT